MKAPPEPRYLGDGVYATFDGYHIWLTTGSHEEREATNRLKLRERLAPPRSAQQRLELDRGQLANGATDRAAGRERDRLMASL